MKKPIAAALALLLTGGVLFLHGAMMQAKDARETALAAAGAGPESSWWCGFPRGVVEAARGAQPRPAGILIPPGADGELGVVFPFYGGAVMDPVEARYSAREGRRVWAWPAARSWGGPRALFEIAADGGGRLYNAPAGAKPDLGRLARELEPHSAYLCIPMNTARVGGQIIAEGL